MLSQDRVWHCVQLCGYLDTVSVAVHFARTGRCNTESYRLYHICSYSCNHIVDILLESS